jgi:hypothetical protein
LGCGCIEALCRRTIAIWTVWPCHPEDGASRPRDRMTAASGQCSRQDRASLHAAPTFPSAASKRSAVVRSLAPASPPLRMTNGKAGFSSDEANREASQTRVRRPRKRTRGQRAARPDPSLRKKRLLGMTSRGDLRGGFDLFGKAGVAEGAGDAFEFGEQFAEAVFIRIIGQAWGAQFALDLFLTAAQVNATQCAAG